VGRTFAFEKQGKTRKTEKNNVDYQCKVFIGFSGFYLFYKKLSIHTKSCRTFQKNDYPSTLNLSEP